MNEIEIKNAALLYHEKYKGKIEITIKSPLETRADLSLAYTPGVGAVAQIIGEDSKLSYLYTNRSNTVAVISNGTAVLGLGDIGVYGAYSVMEGKAALFKKFASIDAFPLCIDEKDPEKFIQIVKSIANNFGAINLEDISAPECFMIETCLQNELDIPVMHDDQWGTSIVVLAGIINALKVVGKDNTAKIIFSGAGAAGIAIAKLLLHYGLKNITLVDSKGIVHKERQDIDDYKRFIIDNSTATPSEGLLSDAFIGADIFIGVSRAGLVTAEMVSKMAPNAIVFALANPVPEIMPDIARSSGALVVATGRSDFANQVNNALVFPKLFRHVLDSGMPFNMDLYVSAAKNLANRIQNPNEENILPSIFDEYKLF